MAHPLVAQLRFTRSEWLRGLKDVSAEEAVRRFEPINSISWMIGHLANHEQGRFLTIAQGKIVMPQASQYGYGHPASTPPLDEVWDMWHAVTKETDIYLDTLTTESLQTFWEHEGRPVRESIGTQLLRLIHHYWFHLGESQAVRQMLGNKNLPSYVGPMDNAPYTPE